MRAVTGSDLHKAEICALWGCVLLHLSSPVIGEFSFGIRQLALPRLWHSIALKSRQQFSVPVSSDQMLGHAWCNWNSHSEEGKTFPQVSDLSTLVITKNKFCCISFHPNLFRSVVKIKDVDKKEYHADPRPEGRNPLRNIPNGPFLLRHLESFVGHLLRVGVKDPCPDAGLQVARL